MRKALTVFLFLALSVVARASLVVWDPGLAAQNAGNEVMNFAKWAKTEVDAAHILDHDIEHRARHDGESALKRFHQSQSDARRRTPFSGRAPHNRLPKYPN